jgi:transposase-like protein
MDMIGRIGRLHSRGKKSEREIARLTGLSRNTISKWLREPIEPAPKYRRSEGTTTLAPFHETLKLSLKVDMRRPAHGRRTAKALFAEIEVAPVVQTVSRVC